MGKDVRGWRRLLGVIGPSTNTIVQPDFDDLRVPGVTNHYSRIVVEDAQAISNETFMAGTLEISQNTLDAVRGVMTCKPDYLVMGMSAVTFYNGIAGGAEFRKRIEDVAGIGVSIGSEALAAALNAYGGIRRVAFLSPYYPVANKQVMQFLQESGFEVVRDICLRCPSWTSIAQVPESRLIKVLRELDGEDVDALCQVGTNLSMVRLAGEAERWLGKPVIAINTATYWHALRANGIADKVYGFGRLLEEH
jgi:maleate isomerase